MSYDKQTAEFVATVAQNIPALSNAEMQHWIGHPRELQSLLAGLRPSNGAGFKIWRTIKLGTAIKDADGYRSAIKAKRMSIGDWANDILGKPAFNVSDKDTEFDLVVVSVAELGFKNGAKLQDIFARAQDKGLQLCPNQVGPELRLQYEDQPNGELLVIGMTPIADSDGILDLFCVERNDSDLWLDSRYGSPGRVWLGDRRFVFVLPRK